MNSRHARECEIAEVLAHHGMGYLIDALGLSRVASAERAFAHHVRGERPPTEPEHVRLALEELGTTFVKLGQIVSTRSDLVTPEYEAELAKLQDAAPRVPREAVGELLAQELGKPPDVVFAHFEFEPLAAASIGQAHAATLHDGTEVVVKVRRPGVVEQVHQDLEILHNLATFANRHWKGAASYDLVGLADDFAHALRNELDYLQEGHNAERFAANFAHDPDVRIPRVFWETTTSRVLTLERMRGMKVNDVDALDRAGVDRQGLATRLAQTTAKMIFEDGLFHADPHPGNFFIEPPARVGMIDFGMVGTVDDRLRQRLAALLISLAREDPDRLAAAVLALGMSAGTVDQAGLRDDIAGLLQRYMGRDLEDMPLGPVIGDLLDVVRRRQLQVPRDLALLLKTLVMEEGVTEEVDPDFRPNDVLQPYAQRLVATQLSPSALLADLKAAGVDAAELTRELPRALASLESGGPELRLRVDELEPLAARIERVGNRVVAGVLAASLIGAAAQLLTRDLTRRNRERPFLRKPRARSVVGAMRTRA